MYGASNVNYHRTLAKAATAHSTAMIENTASRLQNVPSRRSFTLIRSSDMSKETETLSYMRTLMIVNGSKTFVTLENNTISFIESGSFWRSEKQCNIKIENIINVISLADDPEGKVGSYHQLSHRHDNSPSVQRKTSQLLEASTSLLEKDTGNNNGKKDNNKKSNFNGIKKTKLSKRMSNSGDLRRTLSMPTLLSFKNNKKKNSEHTETGGERRKSETMKKSKSTRLSSHSMVTDLTNSPSTSAEKNISQIEEDQELTFRPVFSEGCKTGLDQTPPLSDAEGASECLPSDKHDVPKKPELNKSQSEVTTSTMPPKPQGSSLSSNWEYLAQLQKDYEANERKRKNSEQRYPQKQVKQLRSDISSDQWNQSFAIVEAVKEEGTHILTYKVHTFVSLTPSVCQVLVESLQHSLYIESSKQQRPKNLLVIINPFGGKANGAEIYKTQVAPLFRYALITTEVIETKHEGHAKEIVMNHPDLDFDGIVCVGGDGTFNELLDGLLTRGDNNDIPLGIIPGGSTNCLAYTATGVDSPVTSALHIILGNKRGIDGALVYSEGKLIKYGTTMLSYGFYGNVMKASEKYRWMGPSRYDYAGFQQFMNPSFYQGRISFKKATTASGITTGKTASVVSQTPNNNKTNIPPIKEESSAEKISSLLSSSSSSASPTSTTTTTTTSSTISPSSSSLPSSSLPSSSSSSSSSFPSTSSSNPSSSSLSTTTTTTSTNTTITAPAPIEAATTTATDTTVTVASTPTTTTTIEPSNTLVQEQPCSLHNQYVDDGGWTHIVGEHICVNFAVCRCECPKCPSGVAPCSKMNEGIGDVVIIDKCTRADYLSHLLRLQDATANHLDFPFIRHERVTEIKYKALNENASCWNIDGELFLTPNLHIKLQQNIATMFFPPWIE